MFKVKHAEETVNKTLRFPVSLLEQITTIAQNERVSLNKFVIQCCEYAIKNMDDSAKENNGKTE